MNPVNSFLHRSIFPNITGDVSARILLIVLMLLWFGPAQARAAITVTGDITPAYDGSSDPWDVGDKLTIADTADGMMNIDNGSYVTSNGGIIASSTGVVGTVTVTGADSTWSNTEGLSVGKYGDGTLEISDGGVVTNTHAAIGSSSSSHGTVKVIGSDTIWSNSGSISISDGELTISQGGSVSNTEGVYIGDYSYSGGYKTGKATVTGNGSTWTNSDRLLLGTSGGVGSLTIADGATMTNADYVSVGHSTYATCELTVTGAGSTFTVERDLWVGLREGAGHVLVENGATLSNLEAILGYGSQTSGAVTVSGPDSAWISAGTYVGIWGHGELTVQDGAVLEGGIELGFEASGTGVVHITGAGTTCTTGDVMIGLAGSGTMTIDDGATVSSRQGYIGKEVGATGELTVAGAGTNLSFLRGLFVGQGGSGTLMIRDGAEVNSGSSTLANAHTYLGANTDSSGDATVTGPGSTWNCQGYLLVGFNGIGSLSIENGGTVSSGSGFINGLSGTPGAVTISGQDSSWTNAENLFVGEYGPGILTLDDDAHVSADMDVMIRTQGTVQGNGELSAAVVVNSGLVKPGIDDAGSLKITGDYTQDASGTLAIDLTGSDNTAGVDFDQLDVSAAADIDGQLNVSIGTGFAPRIGDRFDILTAASVTGGFSCVNVWPNMNVVYSTDRITIVIEPLTGDLNSDGFIGLADLDSILINWNTSVPAGSWIHGDPSGDGFVGLDDLDYVLGPWNTGTQPSGVAAPEPGSFALFLLSGWLMVRRENYVK